MPAMDGNMRREKEEGVDCDCGGYAADSRCGTLSHEGTIGYDE